MDRYLVPIGTELECYDNWLEPQNGDMPVYSGAPEDAFMSVTPGMYPGSYVTDDVIDSGTGNVVSSGQQINVVLIVTPDESFAVTTTQSYVGPVAFEPFPN